MGLEGVKVRFFQIWAGVWPVHDQTDPKFGLRKGSKFDFGGVSEFEVQPGEFEAVRSLLHLY